MSSHARPPSAPEDPWVGLGLVLVVAVFGVGALVWGIGQVAGVVFGAGTLSTGLGEMPGVLARLPSTLSDPAAAWPNADRARLPGPVGFYAVTTLALALLAAVGLGAARLSDGRRGGRGGGGSSGARWARVGDLRALIVPRAQPGRLTLGRVGRRLVATEPRASTLVIGPSQSGKTAGLAIPAILEAAGPVVAVSVKRDLLDHTLTARRAVGDVWIYDPTGAARLEGAGLVGWDPVTSCAEWRDARRMAHNLTSAHGASGGRDAEFWLQMAQKLLAPLLFAAAGKIGSSMRDVVSWVDSGEQRAVEELLLNLGEPDAHAAFLATCRREERTLSSVYATTEAVLAPFSDPAVLASTLLQQLRPQALLDGHSTLYIVAPGKDQERLAPLFAGTGRAHRRRGLRGGGRGPAVRPVASSRTRRGRQYCADPKPASDRRDCGRPGDPGRHSLPGPRPGALALRRGRRHHSRQPPRQALPVRHLRRTYPRLPRPRPRRRGGRL